MGLWRSSPEGLHGTVTTTSLIYRPWRDLKGVMWHLGISEGLGSAGLVAALSDFMGLFQPELRFRALPAWCQNPLGWIIPLPVCLFLWSGCQKHLSKLGIRGGWGEGSELPRSRGSLPQPPASFSFNFIYLFIYIFWCKPPVSALCAEPAHSSKKHLHYSQAIW